MRVSPLQPYVLRLRVMCVLKRDNTFIDTFPYIEGVARRKLRGNLDIQIAQGIQRTMEAEGTRQ